MKVFKENSYGKKRWFSGFSEIPMYGKSPAWSDLEKNAVDLNEEDAKTIAKQHKAEIQK